jgi:D-tyrosyl-tRNA(Tyr) deacylase
MKAIVQRVKSASVEVTEENYRADIGKGLLILLGIKAADTEMDVNFVADKCSRLRIFEDEKNKMNIDVQDIKGEVMIISQFTLYGETAKGNRPSFTDAAKPDEAIPLYDKFINRLKDNLGASKVKTGKFGAMMDISLCNYGPVTVIVESKQ